MLYMLITSILLSGFSQNRTLPTALQKCISQDSTISVDWAQRPVYLRVFFTQSKEPTYILAIKEQETHSRALVCKHGNETTVLGSTRSTEPFSTMPGDDYMSSRWRVCSKKDVMALRKYYRGVPTPANEAVCLLWEDGEAIIYSDGHKLRWKSFQP